MNEAKGMRYLDIVANGNAGEFYFAYWISKCFIWPCRILDIDMGLDAQIEIYDKFNQSTGMFIGAQVKTTTGTLKDSPSVSVSLNNIAYWESIKDPTVIVRVCLNNNSEEPSIYWKHLQKNYLKDLLVNADARNNKTVSIGFEEDDLLSNKDKNTWVEFFLSESDKKIIEECESTREKLTYFGEYFEGDSEDDKFKNGIPSNHFLDELNDLLNRYDDLKQAIKVNPRLMDLSVEVSSTVKCYDLHINIILEAVEYGFRYHSLRIEDIDKYSNINSEISNIMNKF